MFYVIYIVYNNICIVGESCDTITLFLIHHFVFDPLET